MSPNPDACDEELPFREGQLIKVFGEKDGDGFYWGEAGTRAGFVPCNMVSEVQVGPSPSPLPGRRTLSPPTNCAAPRSCTSTQAPPMLQQHRHLHTSTPAPPPAPAW